MIILVVAGTAFTNFTESSVSFSMDTFAREFRFLATGTGGNPLPFKGGESCEIYIDEVTQKRQVLNGFIEIVDIDYDSGSHTIVLSGRGMAGDIADSTINKLELTPPISLSGAIEAVIAELKTGSSVINEVPEIKDFTTVEDQLGGSGKNAFEFIEELARKRQVILNESGGGDIVITRAQTIKYKQKLQNLINNDANNIKGASVSYDETRIFKEYIARSSLNAVGMNFAGSSDLSEVVSQEGSSTNENSRNGRRFVFISEKASSNDQLVARAKWESNIRRARSRTYSVTYTGHLTTFDELWTTNKLISVNDEFAGIAEDMLVNSVKYTESLSGNLVELGLIDKDAYTPAPAEDLSTGVGNQFVFETGAG